MHIEVSFIPVWEDNFLFAGQGINVEFVKMKSFTSIQISSVFVFRDSFNAESRQSGDMYTMIVFNSGEQQVFGLWELVSELTEHVVIDPKPAAGFERLNVQC